jgi:hypothetical protein
MLKTPSVTVAPTSRMPKFAPSEVVTGISELRRMCTGITRRVGSPLPNAIRTKSWLEVSMTDERVSRSVTAKLMLASTSAGSTRSCHGAPCPTVVLNHPSWMASPN